MTVYCPRSRFGPPRVVDFDAAAAADVAASIPTSPETVRLALAARLWIEGREDRARQLLALNAR